MFPRRIVRAAWLACAVGVFFAADKPETWFEVKSPHFLVVSNAGPKQAQRAAEQFEQIRAVFQSALPKARVDPGQPIIILATKNENGLKALIPKYWEVKGEMHPAGIFVTGPEKNYVSLRLDAQGENPYHVIYHEYVHQLIQLNFERIPLWLNEGLAEFYGNTTIVGKDVGLGRPSGAHLELLRESKRIPLEALLTADHRSPYYNEQNKASVFYAQSWAMTHYFVLGDKGAHSKQLIQFLTLLQQNVGDLDAARQAFGDLKQFQNTMDVYTRQNAYYYVPMKAPFEGLEKDFQIRELSPAESAARRGDFHVAMNRPQEARALLEESLRLDPKLALAQESMGMLLLREGKSEEAQPWFERAVENDSKSFLAHYLRAMLASKGRMTPDGAALAEAGLRRAIELNPNFAPAYSTLATLYILRGEKLDEALQMARRAASLEPGFLQHHLTVASVLLRMEKVVEAQKLAESVLAASRSEQDVSAATQFLQNLEQFRLFLAEKKQREDELRRSLETPPKEPAPPAEPAESLRPAARAPEQAGPAPQPEHVTTAPGEGSVTSVSCTGKSLDLTLSLASFKLAVHSEDYSRIKFLKRGWNPPPDFNPCVHLKGKYVKVEYRIVLGKSYAGEIVSIEVAKP